MLDLTRGRGPRRSLRASRPRPSEGTDPSTGDAIARCDAGDAAACFDAARTLPGGSEARRRNLARACELSHAVACAEQGIDALQTGSLRDAVRSLQHACELGAALGCTLLAEGHWTGEVGALRMARSRRKARELHERAWALTVAPCESGHGDACFVAGTALVAGHTRHNDASGIAIAKDAARGRALHVRACDELAFAEACREVASSLRSSDRSRSEQFRRRACALGLESTCDER